MPPCETIPWKFVEREGKQWRCPYCKNKYGGGVTRVTNHLLKIEGKGISICKKAPDCIGELMKWLLDQVPYPNKEDIAWKFVERLEDDKWRCHHCKEESFGDATAVKCHLLRGSSGGISICPEVPDTIRKLMLSLLEEAAKEESREAHCWFSMELQSHDLPTEAQAWVAEEESREACCRFSTEQQLCSIPSSLSPQLYENVRHLLRTLPGPADSTNFNQQDVIGLNSDQQLQAECQFHQCSTMPSPVQSSHGESMSCSEEGESYLCNSSYYEEILMNDQLTPAGELSPQCDQSHTVGNSNCLKDSNQHPQLQTPMDMDPSIASQHASDSLDIEATASDLQVPEAATNAIGSSSSQVVADKLGMPNSAPTGALSFQYDRTAVPHSNQPHPSCKEERETETSSFPLRELMDRFFPTAMHVDLQFLEGEANMAGPSSSQELHMKEDAPMTPHPYTGDNFEENRALKRKLEVLAGTAANIRDEIEFGASLSLKKVKMEVANWLMGVEKLGNDSAEAACEDCLPSHEEVDLLMREAEDLRRQGKGLFEARETKGSKFFEGKMLGEAFRRNTTKILKYLVGNQISQLGIHGMGGVGKTTIMKHVHNRLLTIANYGNVLWINVSQEFNTKSLQDNVWYALNMCKLEEEDVRKRAAILSDCLIRSGKSTIIFDDVWAPFDLKEVGIPVRADGIKLVFTTRSLDVCRQMCCQENIKIEPLSKIEAETLFLEELGSDVALNLETKIIVESMVEECAGLPLAVITMARSMRGVTNLFEWKDTLEKLRESDTGQTDMAEKVLINLQCSYDHLYNSQVQHCFLFCALYPEDQLIEKFELIEFFIDQGLIGALDTREKQYDRGLTILTKLENVCLLEAHGNYMKMCRLIRDMALHIMGATSMVKAGKGLTEIPHEDYWTDALEKVSLMENDIREFPLDMSPNCPKLSTLLLNNSLRQVSVIPDSFFERLWGLEYLNLSGCGLTELPNSISDLVNLRALLLTECWELRHIPCVGKLTYLRKLDAWGCASLEEIEGLETLVNLRYLDLSGTRIERLPKGTSGGMLKLQYLKVSAPIEEDITNLVALETLECCFEDADDFNKCARVIEQSNARRYSLTMHPFKSISGREVSNYDPVFNLDKIVIIEGWSHAIVGVGGECSGIFILTPRDVQTLVMTNCDGPSSLADMGPLKCLEKLFIEGGENLQVLLGGQDEEVMDIHDSPATTPSPPLFPSLGLLQIDGCPKLKYLFGYGSKFSLPHLRKITIRNCEEMEGIMATVASPPPCPNPAFPSLEKIVVSFCGKMKRVVESEWLPHFPNLRETTVEYCRHMEEIIGGPPPNMTVGEIPLESLEVTECDEMRMLFTHEWLIHLRNLQRIRVDCCGGMVEMISSGAGQSQEGSTRSEAGQSQGGSIMTPVTDTSSRSSISLPKLTHLRLCDLPRLQSICEVSVTCDSIEYIRVGKCPELKGIPLRLQLRDIEDLPYIWVDDEETWNMLTWDRPDAQAILLPYLRKGEEANKRIKPWGTSGMSPTTIELPGKTKDLEWHFR